MTSPNAESKFLPTAPLVPWSDPILWAGEVTTKRLVCVIPGEIEIVRTKCRRYSTYTLTHRISRHSWNRMERLIYAAGQGINDGTLFVFDDHIPAIPAPAAVEVAHQG